jgi:hypothetical protein
MNERSGMRVRKHDAAIMIQRICSGEAQSVRFAGASRHNLSILIR